MNKIFIFVVVVVVNFRKQHQSSFFLYFISPFQFNIALINAITSSSTYMSLLKTLNKVICTSQRRIITNETTAATYVHCMQNTTNQNALLRNHTPLSVMAAVCKTSCTIQLNAKRSLITSTHSKCRPIKSQHCKSNRKFSTSTPQHNETHTADITNELTIYKSKQAMRLIYARVHPDLYTNHLQAQVRSIT